VRGPARIPSRKRLNKKGRSNMSGNNQGGGMAATYAESFSVKNFMQKSMTLKGCDLLYIVSIPSNLTNSTVLAEFDLNPLQLTSATRLKQFAPLWDKFKWKALCITYKAACGTDTQGLLNISADPDKLDGYTHLSGLPLDQKCSASLHNINSAPNLPFFMAIKDKKFFGETRFMEPKGDSDPRLYTAGKLVLTNQGALSAGTYGRFYLNWEIQFEEPNIDDLIDQGIATATGNAGTYNSVTYPWGQYSLIETDAEAGVSTCAFRATNYCDLSSDATRGSVITFRRAGCYLVTIARTGVGQTTGFTGATFTNCSVGWDLDLGLGIGPNSALAATGGGSSNWIAAITASEDGATMSKTTDGVVTHNTSTTSVAFVAELPTVDFELQDKMVGMLRSLLKDTDIDLSKLNIRTRKSANRVNAIGPTSINSGFIRQGDGPAKEIDFTSTGSVLGTLVDPIVVEIAPPPLKKPEHKEKKSKPSKSVKLTFPSDSDD
jgi:hypothetical protein